MSQDTRVKPPEISFEKSHKLLTVRMHEALNTLQFSDFQIHANIQYFQAMIIKRA